jgi:hypothetical protein
MLLMSVFWLTPQRIPGGHSPEIADPNRSGVPCEALAQKSRTLQLM